MSLFKGLIDKARSAFGRATTSTAAVADHTDAVARDYLDELTWKETRTLAPELERLIEELSERHNHAEDFVGDIFSGCIQGDPLRNLRLKAELRPSYRPYRDLVTELIDTPEMQELRTLSEYDQYDAALATLSMASKIETVLERFKEAEQKAEEAAEKAAEAAEKAERAQEAADATEAAEQALQDHGDTPAPDPDTDPDGAAEHAAASEGLQQAVDGCGAQLQARLQAAEAAAEAAEQADDAAEQASAAAVRASREDMRNAIEEADDERQEETELFEAFGVGRGQLQQMPWAERAELATMLANCRIGEFRDLIGSMRTRAKGSRKRRVQHAPSEIFNVELSGAFDRLIPAEMVNMAIPELQDDFYKRLLQEELLTYKLRGTEKLGQGAIIVVNDESGTMTRADMAGGATREALSKALTLALLDGAREAGRDFVYIGFASTYEQVVRVFPKGRGELADVVAMVEHFFNGGTEFQTPLLKAAEIIEADFMDREYSRADVVFMTDGQAPITPEFQQRWRQVKDKAQFRTFGIVVGTDVNTRTVEAVSDNVRQITRDNSTPESFDDLFQVI